MARAALGGLIAAALLATPVLVEAQTLDHASTQLKQSIAYDHVTESAGAPQISFMDLTPPDDFVRPYALTSGLTRERMPLTASVGDAGNGPVGSIGMVHMGGVLDRTLMPNSVANLPGAPASTVGAEINYRFK